MAARDGSRPRPPDTPAGEATEELAPNALQLFDGYGTPEETYRTPDVVVHYVVSGVSAPPLNDDDHDGVPDYVERTARAADRAIASFAAAGFRPIRGDRGGPNPLPDLYVSRLTPGYFGAAIAPDRGDGGAFVVLANWLDPSPTRSLGSLQATVAHELFHLVQFSYFPRGTDAVLPPWIEEGTAGGMERRVFPEVDDLLWRMQALSWLHSPSRSVTGESYGAELFWSYVEQKAPSLLPAYFAALTRRPGAARLPLLSETCAAVGAPAPAALFHAFAVATRAEYPDALAPTAELARSEARITTRPLSLQYLRLPSPTKLGYRVTVRFTQRGSGRTAALVYSLRSAIPGGWPKQIRPQPTFGGGLVSWLIRDRPRLEAPALILTDPSTVRPTAYRVRLTPCAG